MTKRVVLVGDDIGAENMRRLTEARPELEFRYAGTDDAFLAALAQHKDEVDLPTLIYLLAQVKDEQQAGWVATVDWVRTLIEWQQELDQQEV